MPRLLLAIFRNIDATELMRLTKRR